MTGIVLHGAHLGRGAECIRDPLGGALVIGRERDADMAIVEDGVVRPIGLLDLIEALRDQKASDAVARHEGKLPISKKSSRPSAGNSSSISRSVRRPSLGIQALRSGAGRSG